MFFACTITQVGKYDNWLCRPEIWCFSSWFMVNQSIVPFVVKWLEILRIVGMLCCGMKWNENVLMFFVFCHHGVVQGMDYVSPICLGKVILVFKSHRVGQGKWYSKAHMLGGDPPERLVWPLCPTWKTGVVPGKSCPREIYVDQSLRWPNGSGHHRVWPPSGYDSCGGWRSGRGLGTRERWAGSHPWKPSNSCL